MFHAYTSKAYGVLILAFVMANISGVISITGEPSQLSHIDWNGSGHFHLNVMPTRL